MTTAQRPDLTAMLASFTGLSIEQQDTVGHVSLAAWQPDAA